jgi:hypothetical protein
MTAFVGIVTEGICKEVENRWGTEENVNISAEIGTMVAKWVFSRGRWSEN